MGVPPYGHLLSIQAGELLKVNDLFKMVSAWYRERWIAIAVAYQRNLKRSPPTARSA